MSVTPRLLQVGAFFLPLHARIPQGHPPRAGKSENTSENSLKSPATFYVSLKENIHFPWRKRTFRVRETYVSAPRNVKHNPGILRKQKENNPFTPDPPENDSQFPQKKWSIKDCSSMNHFLHLYTISCQLNAQFCSSIDLAIPISSPLNSASPLKRPRQE